MNKLSRTWSLMKASWEILKQDKEMIVFPLLSSIACLVVLASFLYPLYLSASGRPAGAAVTPADQVSLYGCLFLLYFCNYLVIVFFNAAIIGCATIRIEGGDPTVSDGLRAAWGRLGPIVGWALVLATVGLILRMIEQRSRRIGDLVAGLLGLSWSVASFLVVPILVAEQKGPFEALKESAALLKRTWGEQLIGDFSFGLVFFLLSIPALLLVFFVFHGMEGFWMIFLLILIAEYLIALGLIQSTLQAVFQAAVYQYARHGSMPPGFRSEEIDGALKRSR